MEREMVYFLILIRGGNQQQVTQMKIEIALQYRSAGFFLVFFFITRLTKIYGHETK